MTMATASRKTGASRNAKSVPSKSTPMSAMREAARDERRQERADARGGAETDALEDVEERASCRDRPIA